MHTNKPTNQQTNRLMQSIQKPYSKPMQIPFPQQILMMRKEKQKRRNQRKDNEINAFTMKTSLAEFKQKMRLRGVLKWLLFLVELKVSWVFQ